MKNKKKRILATLLTALVGVSIAGTLSVSVSAAGNVSDTHETCYISQFGAFTWTGSARKKYDDTSSYQKCLSTNYTYQSSVYGSNVKNPTDLSQLKMSLKHPTTGQATQAYNFQTGTERYMVNFVKENNITYAGMVFSPSGRASHYAEILWSPDSV